MARIRFTLLKIFFSLVRHLSRECHCHHDENIDENSVTLRREHDPDLLPLWEVGTEPWLYLYLCDCREYIVS
jgi:hypothetical protein